MVFKRGQQRDANTKKSKDTVLESDDFPLRRSPILGRPMAKRAGFEELVMS